jgi:hypothetical protein
MRPAPPASNQSRDENVYVLRTLAQRDRSSSQFQDYEQMFRVSAG